MTNESVGRQPGGVSIDRLAARLCTLYGLEPDVSLRDFVVDDAGRAAMLEAMPSLASAGAEGREALLIHEDTDELLLALLLRDDLSTSDPLQDAGLDGHCALLEGISHLLYVLDRARAQRPVSRLELELQAEVDKFVDTWLLRREAQVPISPAQLRKRLFTGFTLEAAPEAVPRYREASRLAERYCGWLSETYLQRARMDSLLPEVRRFWRMSQSDKIGHIESR